MNWIANIVRTYFMLFLGVIMAWFCFYFLKSFPFI